MTRHYSDEELTRYLAGDYNGLESIAVQQHLNECPACKSIGDSVRDFIEVLGDDVTWVLADATALDTDPDDRIQMMLQTALQEDEDAAELLGRIIDKPAAITFADLPRKRRYHTAGVARLLCRAAREMLAQRPADALVLADNSIAVAQALNNAKYPSSMRHVLTGTAWKERANALRILGDPVAALSAFDNAEREFRRVTGCELEIARIAFGRATVYEKSYQLPRAIQSANECAELFSKLRETRWRISALIVVGNSLHKQSRFGEARETYRSLIPTALSLKDDVLVASIQQNAGWSEAELGLFAEARSSFAAALAVFERRGLSSYALQARWGAARLPLLEGRAREALKELSDLFGEALTLQMEITAALIVLDIAEALTIVGRRRDISPLCRYAITVFRRAGRVDSSLTALAYLKDSSRAGSIRTDTFSQLRTFFRRLEDQPNLLFLPLDGPR